MLGRISLCALFLLAIVSVTESTLSKSANSAAKEKEKPVKTNVKVEQRVIEEDETARDEILTRHHQLDSSKPKRNFVKIGYVTPWNNHGYDVAKWTAKKYTHIAPVWFQLTPEHVNDELSCEFRGQHDIDRGWLDDIRKNNSDIKIVPRFILEPKDSQLFQQFITGEAAQLRCADDLAAFLQRNEFDGVVLEFWLQILVATRGAAVDYLIEMTEVFGKRLRMRDLIYIVPITPPVRSLQPEGKTYMPTAVIPRLVNAVDYLNVMTYDFSGDDAEGSAPMPWIENNIWLFMHDDPNAAKKILLGLNYYGNCKGQLNDVIMGTKFVEILRNPEFDLEWNDVSKENFITNGPTVCYFPTLRSITERLELVKREGLGGIGIWELGQGLDHFTSIL